MVRLIRKLDLQSLLKIMTRRQLMTVQSKKKYSSARKVVKAVNKTQIPTKRDINFLAQ